MMHGVNNENEEDSELKNEQVNTMAEGQDKNLAMVCHLISNEAKGDRSWMMKR